MTIKEGCHDSMETGNPTIERHHSPIRDEAMVDSEVNVSELDQKEENTMQMVRVLQGRLKAMAKFAVIHQTIIGKKPYESELSTEINDSNDERGRTERRIPKTVCRESNIYDENDHDYKIIEDNTNESYRISSLAYRNSRTPHTDAQSRIESIFQEYQDEIVGSTETEEKHLSFRQLKRAKSSRKLSVQGIFDRDIQRKRLQSLQSQLENNSTRYLARASNSLVFRVQNGQKDHWPIPISESEMNPSLLIQLSLQMITHPRTRRDMERVALHEISQELFVHAFWLTHVQFFQKLSWREQKHLQHKISAIYPKILTVVTQSEQPSRRDSIFRTYPLVTIILFSF